MAMCVLLSLWPAAAAGASAQRSTADAPGDNFSLTISPTRLIVSPRAIGKDQKVDVINGGSTPMTVTVQKRNFVGRMDGTLLFKEKAPYSASTWVDLDQSTFVVAPGTTKTVTASIAMPAAPEAGDHQVALVFLVPAGKTKDNVRINRGIAIPIYITVPGPTNDSATVTKLEADGFSTGGPVRIDATVHNTGNVHRDFRAKHPLEVRAEGDVTKFSDFTVMRGGTQKISTTWDPPLFCICHPTVTIANADGTTASKSVRVIVLPLPLIAAVLGATVLLVGIWWFTRRRFRSHVASAAAALAGAAGVSDA